MDASDAVLKYLKDQNRPYSTNDIFTNMHKEYGKTAIQKAIDGLVQNNFVKEKTYGKQKVYAFNQTCEVSNIPDVGNVDIDDETSKVTEELSKLEKQIKEYDNALHQLKSSLPTSDAEIELSKVSSEIENLQKEIKDLKNNPESISTAEREKIISTHERYVKEWRKRKNQCMQMVSTVIENLPQNKVTFMQELGIETDEDVNVSLSDMESVR